MTLLITGTAGFIGAALAQRYLEQGETVVGLDAVTDYYDVRLKQARLQKLRAFPTFIEVCGRLETPDLLTQLCATHRPTRFIHLAAQAGVRYSLTHPQSYVDSNLVGFLKVLEACRAHPVEHLVYASTSSVYGANTKLPFSVHDPVNHPLTLYAATKRANELMAHSYSHLFGIPCTGLRFFTVYGPWGRPDMALFKFTERLLQGQPLPVFNYGRHRRDFTYIDDIVTGIMQVCAHPPTANPQWDAYSPDGATSAAPWRVFNLGNQQPVELLDYIALLGKALGIEPQLEKLPLQAGDVPDTHADVSDLQAAVHYCPCTPVEVGITRFVEWYRDYYDV